MRQAGRAAQIARSRGVLWSGAWLVIRCVDRSSDLMQQSSAERTRDVLTTSVIKQREALACCVVIHYTSRYREA